ncbi:isocitrate lyase/PEP mutase family protein [Chitinophaga vietnamensis]|uniref:isocitrate lyase/PEP mutase family protein n=1 Tax=Chitinophaga vietnamensis TaxID=2593957 RepID=UPI0011786E42|nr:isocitrate lyase/phosphoenolpyruvate mutase family protein [Chitinophaga vietnamensis]
MFSKFEQFKHLHTAPGLLVLPNAWNAKSAQVFQDAGAKAVATSSMAVANSLGYDDGEAMSFDEYLFIVKRILSAVDIPVSVDIEMGYGHTKEEIYDHIATLAQLGVAGINIEDSQLSDGARSLQAAETFAANISYIKEQLTAAQLAIFINIRCDTYILNVDHKQAATQQRLALYEHTGADGIFLPCITAPEDIAAAVKATTLPLNVMCIPGLPDFQTLQQLGVKRASAGPFLFSKAAAHTGELYQQILRDNNFSSIL